jgi:hypothetical protein
VRSGGLTIDAGVPVDVADGLIFAVVEIGEGLVFLEVGIHLPTHIFTQGPPVVHEHVHYVVLLEGPENTATCKDPKKYILYIYIYIY